MQLQRSGNYRRAFNARPRAFVAEHTAQDERVKLHGYLKGKSALMIFDRHGNLKYKFGNRHFWAEGYYVSTVGMKQLSKNIYRIKRNKT